MFKSKSSGSIYTPIGTRGKNEVLAVSLKVMYGTLSIRIGLFGPGSFLPLTVFNPRSGESDDYLVMGALTPVKGMRLEQLRVKLFSDSVGATPADANAVLVEDNGYEKLAAVIAKAAEQDGFQVNTDLNDILRQSLGVNTPEKLENIVYPGDITKEAPVKNKVQVQVGMGNKLSDEEEEDGTE